mgnify:CR=1 FL=1
MLGEVEAILDLTRFPESKDVVGDQDTPIIVEVTLSCMLYLLFVIIVRHGCDCICWFLICDNFRYVWCQILSPGDANVHLVSSRCCQVAWMMHYNDSLLFLAQTNERQSPVFCKNTKPPGQSKVLLTYPEPLMLAPPFFWVKMACLKIDKKTPTMKCRSSSKIILPR